MNKYWAIVAIWAAVAASSFAPGDVVSFVAFIALFATMFVAD